MLVRLHTHSETTVEMGEFTEDWLTPGFSARRIRLSDRDGDVIAMDRIAVRGSYVGLISKPFRLEKIEITGLRIVLAAHHGASEPFGISSAPGSKPKFQVDEIRLNNAMLRVPRDSPGLPPLDFAFQSAIPQDLGPNTRVRFQIAAHNPIPSAEVHLKGHATPFAVSSLRNIPIEGQFTFEKANLSVPHSISGLLNASGNCRGTMGDLKCAGTADVPEFQVYGSKNPVHIASRYQAAVDTLTGNAKLSEVLAHFNRTTVSATGQVSGDPDPKGKTLTLDMAVHDGRLEDLLELFTSAPTPGMRAAIDMRGRFVIPPGPPDFLTKLRVNGEFSLSRASFTNPETQTPLDRLAASAEGVPKKQQRKNPETATANVRAGVTARNGVADLREVVFDLPGIQGHLAGTFRLHDKQVSLNGVFETQGKLSDTSSGLKALLLKMIGPLWPKTGSVRSIPFAISGRGSQSSFRLRLHEK
ncbi:MAG TPA: hypothetical protein VGM43_27020 [Bryobacteraceae bacterium]